MSKRCLILLNIAFIIACLINMDDALSYQPSIQTIDRVDGIIYHQNGTISHSIISSILTVINPSSSSPLTAVNVTSPDGLAWFIKSLEPQSNFSQPYTLRDDNITIPLKLNEYIAPSSLYAGTQQEIRLLVEIENTGDSNITGFFYQKELPAGLSTVWTANDGGIVSINDTVTWTLDDMAPGQKNRMVAAFNLAPAYDINFTAASIHFTYLKPQARDDPSFSGYTNTTFKIAKSHPGEGTWQINATVPDESEFDISLDSVKIYRSHASDPFNTTEIASYTPNTMLSTGSEWNTQLIDYYGLVPAYFIKINYTIPYTLDRKSFFTASTEPFSIAVYSQSSNVTPRPPIYHYNYPYIIWNPTIVPTPTPIPTEYPDIVLISPASSAVIRDNVTLIKTSVPPSSSAGYVIYYGSTDNQTWTKIGESNITGNVSEIMWTVPQINGIYYLKVEHYDSMGLRGVDYAQLVIAHEIQPVDIRTMLISVINWPILFLSVSMILLLFILIPYFLRKPIVYDSSTLYVLSKDDRHSKLSRRAIRPEGHIDKIPGLERIKKTMPIRDIDGMKRLQDEYGLLDYDAMALKLAEESGATLYTADKRIYEIGKRLGISVKLLDRKENT